MEKYKIKSLCILLAPFTTKSDVMKQLKWLNSWAPGLLLRVVIWYDINVTITKALRTVGVLS